MNVVITGGAGFLGGLLARRILSDGSLGIGGGEPAEVDQLTLVDLVAPTDDLAADPRVRVLVGDLAGSAARVGPVDAMFHLAGVVSGAAEADFDLGLRTNVDALRTLLDACRALEAPPVLVFSSSLAVFGADPAIGPLGVIDDNSLPRPQSSYGIQKFIGEQLVADYTRKCFLRGRSIRLMTVAVRPGQPNAAASSFVSGIIREPLAGKRAMCPVPLDTPIALSSPRLTVDGLLTAARVDDASWGSRAAMNSPALTITPAAMLAALDRVTGAPTSRLVDPRPDPVTSAIVTSWPARFDTPRARALGLTAPTNFDSIIREHTLA